MFHEHLGAELHELKLLVSVSKHDASHRGAVIPPFMHSRLWPYASGCIAAGVLY